MLRIYCAALVVAELPTIIRLIQGDIVSKHSAWFGPGTNDTPEMALVYAALLTLLCVSRATVISFPQNRGILFNAALVHTVEIPLFMSLFRLLPSEQRGIMQYGLMSAILINPIFFLQAALKAKKS